MKKTISLFLIIIIICTMLTSCNMGEMLRAVTFWNLPQGVIETTALDKKGNSVNIAHSGDFTQDDI